MTLWMLEPPPITDEQRLELCRRVSLERRTQAPIRIWAEVLLRVFITEQLGIRNGAIRWEWGPHGKPGLAGFPDFQFNLSHTEGAVVLACAEGEAVGVDVETLSRGVDQRIAARFFTEYELEWIQQSERERAYRLLSVWTRKEAYLKRDGRGITVPLRGFDVLCGDCAAELQTQQVGGYVLSTCGSGEMPVVQQLLPGWVYERAMALELVDGSFR